MKTKWALVAIILATSISAPTALGAVSGLFITGHDTDQHGNGDYQRAGLDYLSFGHAATVAEAATRSSIKVGFLGQTDGSSGGALVSGYTNRVFIDLDNANWWQTAFNGTFDILMIGTGGDYVFAAGSAALNARSADFAAYFNNGGQIFVNTDQGSIGQSFYNFLPTFGATQAAVGGVGVYSVTAAGLAIGLTESIVDRDITHTEYKNVNTSLFTIFETHNQTGDAVAIGLRNAVIGDGGFSSVPEPATCAIWSLFVASAVGYGFRRRAKSA